MATVGRRNTAWLVGACVAVSLAMAGLFALIVLVVPGGDEAVQYPPGQRPCGEATDAFARVDIAQLSTGKAFEDPDGSVTDALEDARDVLNDRAGQSSYYDAAEYDRLADATSIAAKNLEDAYEREDPDTPYADSPDTFWVSQRYDDARGKLTDWCEQ